METVTIVPPNGPAILPWTLAKLAQQRDKGAR